MNKIIPGHASFSGSLRSAQLPDLKLAAALAVEESGKPFPLKENWRVSLGPQVKHAFPGGNGDVFVVFPERVVILGPDGEKKHELPVANACSVGEVNGRIYIATHLRESNGIPYVRDRIQQSLYAFKQNGEFLWHKIWQAEDGQSSHTPDTPTCAVEDPLGRIWIKANNKIYRISHDGQNQEVAYREYMFPHPMFVDGKGFAYTYWGEKYRFDPQNFSVQKIDGHPNYFFFIHDQPYEITKTSLAVNKLDFDQQKSKSIFFWPQGEQPVPPFVDEKGRIHLYFFNWSANYKKGRYLVLDSEGKTLRKKELNLTIKIDRSSQDWPRDNWTPMVIRNGIVYLASEKMEERKKDPYPLYALDGKDHLHTTFLPDEPFWLFPGKGNSVVVGLKNGTFISVEIKPREEIVREKERELRRERIVRRISNRWDL